MALLLDVAGEDVAREVRAASATPVMMLTAKTGTASGSTAWNLALMTTS